MSTSATPEWNPNHRTELLGREDGWEYVIDRRIYYECWILFCTMRILSFDMMSIMVYGQGLWRFLPFADHLLFACDQPILLVDRFLCFYPFSIPSSSIARVKADSDDKKLKEVKTDS